MRTTVKVLAGGKVTIPAPVREELDIEKGDVIEIEVQE